MYCRDVAKRKIKKDSCEKFQKILEYKNAKER